jgi:hypothetical protein
MELWTILDWTNPGAFGKASEWKNRVVLPLTSGQSKDSTDEQRLIADVRLYDSLIVFQT